MAHNIDSMAYYGEPPGMAWGQKYLKERMPKQ